MSYLFKFLTYYYSFVSFFQRKILIKNINENDLVLDVGSGDKPFWRADVIVDKFLEDDQQRHSGGMVYDKKKLFVEADVENLPFKDKVFDFVFCSHLLEHVENPDKAIKELTRVAKKGYIEVPYGIMDFFEPFPPHLWFCDFRDGVLYFMQKEKEKNFFIQNTEEFGKKFFWDPLFQYLLAKNQDKIFIELYWKNTLRYKVIRSSNHYRYVYKRDVGQVKSLITKIGFFFYKFIYSLINVLFYKKKKLSLNELLKS